MELVPGLTYRAEDGVVQITFARPHVLNALTLEVYARFRDLLIDLRRDDAVRAVVVTGEGRGFCSGGDVHEIIGVLLQQGVREHMAFTRMTCEVVENMRALDKPIIAAVNGIAAGAGAVIALASDLRIASPQAQFAFLFTKVGLAGADMGAAYLLPRVVGLGRAMELLLFGETVDAETAERYGLVNRVVPHEALLPTAWEWARRLAEGPTLAIGMTKRLVTQELDMDLYGALIAESYGQALLLMSEDHRAFYEAFRRKEVPKFTGR